MTPRALLWTFALAALAVLFIIAVRGSLALQTESGAAFPPYSTLRADPLGARALYEALASLPGVTVEQNVRALRFLDADANTTLFVLGVDESPDSDRDLEALETFVADGGRLVIAYAIRGDVGYFCLTESEADEIAHDSDNEDGEATLRQWLKQEEVPALAPNNEREAHDWKMMPGDYDLASDRWGFRVVAPMDTYEFAESEALFTTPAPNYAFAMPMPWKSPEYFLPIHPAWRTLYTAGPDDRPVLIHRKFGKGQIIVASDAYLFSNEAMRNHRQPALLAWMLGDTRHVVFEETTKGLSREPGIMAMLRRYRLHGLVAAAALVALLVAWRSAVPLLPRRTDAQERERAHILLGRDAHAGLANLLRTATPGTAVLSTCHNEWERSLGRTARILPQSRQTAHELLTQKLEASTPLNAETEILHRYLAAQDLLRQDHPQIFQAPPQNAPKE